MNKDKSKFNPEIKRKFNAGTRGIVIMSVLL